MKTQIQRASNNISDVINSAALLQRLISELPYDDGIELSGVAAGLTALAGNAFEALEALESEL